MGGGTSSCSRRRCECICAGVPGSKSRVERRFRRLVVGAGLPALAVNVVINGFEVDAYWPGLCVEVDGVGHRRARSKVEDRIKRRGTAGGGLRGPAVHGGRRRLPARVGASAARGAAASPDALRGSEGTGSIVLGILKRARRAAANLAQLPSARARPRRTTWAVTASPHSASGRPNTPASATAGWASRAASTSLGMTFSPPLTIVSTLRPRTPQTAAVVDLAQVAGLEAARRRWGRRRRSPHCLALRAHHRFARGAIVHPGPGERLAPRSRCPHLRDRHRRARLREPVGRRDGPARVAGARPAAWDRRARRRASPREATGADSRSSSRPSWVGTSEAIVTSVRSAGPSTAVVP